MKVLGVNFFLKHSVAVLSIWLFAVFTVTYAVKLIIAFVDVNKTYLILSCLFICLSCLSVAKMQKNAIFWKTKQFRATVSVDDL